jgi:ATP-dependent 26S proteasome regulatory subunit
MDIAFSRRFQTIIYFPAPNVDQRYELWTNSFKNLEIDKDVDFMDIANNHTLTGGSIINVLRFCSLAALRRGSRVVNDADIQEGISRELQKAGKTL